MISVYESVAIARDRVLGRSSAGSVDLPELVRDRIRQVFGENLTAAQVVDRIVADVRVSSDSSIRWYTAAFDGVSLDELAVDESELDLAMSAISQDLRDALSCAADRIRVFHERSRRNTWLDFSDGGVLGQMVVPIDRVGIYAPGGRAVYPSTVLMAAIPARVAGVRDVTVVTPPGEDGRVNPLVLAAARVAGVDRVYRVGGAQAIAALAFGTKAIQRVDKIVGPGNLFVVLAKQAVASIVGLDGLPGPTETVVIADSTANPRWIAWDMLAQAEHDPLAQSLVIATDRTLVERILEELRALLPSTPRHEIIASSFRERGAVVVAASLEEAIDFANEHAPEHLCLAIANPWEQLGKVRNAGGVFVGERSVEAIGDYTAGPSHIMPTGGTARFASPLTVDDFTKIISVFGFGDAQIHDLGIPAIALARAEGLMAHASAIEARLAEPGQRSVVP